MTHVSWKLKEIQRNYFGHITLNLLPQVCNNKWTAHVFKWSEKTGNHVHVLEVKTFSPFAPLDERQNLDSRPSMEPVFRRSTNSLQHQNSRMNAPRDVHPLTQGRARFPWPSNGFFAWTACRRAPPTDRATHPRQFYAQIRPERQTRWRQVLNSFGKTSRNHCGEWQFGGDHTPQHGHIGGHAFGHTVLPGGLEIVQKHLQHQFDQTPPCTGATFAQNLVSIGQYHLGKQAANVRLLQWAPVVRNWSGTMRRRKEKLAKFHFRPALHTTRATFGEQLPVPATTARRELPEHWLSASPRNSPRQISKFPAWLEPSTQNQADAVFLESLSVYQVDGAIFNAHH